MDNIMDERDVEAIHRRFGKSSQIALLCQSHEELRHQLEERIKEEKQKDGDRI